MRHRTRPLRRERQPELGALQSLALALLVAAQHQRLCWRIEVEPDHIPEFFLELRIVRELEGPGDMRLQLILRPDTLHRAVRYADMTTHAAHAPALAAFRRPRHLANDPANLRLRYGRAAAPSWLVVEAGKTLVFETLRPGRNALCRRAEFFRDSFNAYAFHAQQNDRRPLLLAHGAGRGPRPALKLPHNLRICMQSLNRRSHPVNPPRKSHCEQILVDFCETEH